MVTTLDIEAEVGMMHTVQQEFEDTVQKKNEEVFSRAGQSSVTAYRDLRKYLSALLDHIAFKASEGASRPFTDAISGLNEVTTIANASISNSGSVDNEPPENEDFQETMTVTES